jgi:hypothetical protein
LSSPGQQDIEFCTDDLEVAALTNKGASGELYRGHLHGRSVAFMNLMAAKRKATTSSSFVHQDSISSTSAKVYQDMPVCIAARGLFQRAEPGPSQVREWIHKTGSPASYYLQIVE